MKTIGILTFHAAYNYGSMLQSYALLRICNTIGKAEVINMRNARQKQQYQYFIDFRKEGVPSLRRLIKHMLFLPFRKGLKKKNQLFENFLSEYLTRVEETDENNVFSHNQYDCYISGSDQIWNPIANDFSWEYLFDSLKHGKKISYAASMGPSPHDVLSLPHGTLDRMAKDLSSYDALSVREKGTQDALKKLGVSGAEIHVDPTLLLSKEEWVKLAGSKERIVKEKYIFFYNPVYVENTYRAARELSKHTGLKIVSSNVANFKSMVKYPDFKYIFGCGPIEFLNLIQNAEFVIGHSFHLMVFSVLFGKKFVAVNGMKDSRIKELLELSDLTCNATNEKKSCIDVYNNCKVAIDVEAKLADKRMQAIDYLKRNIL